MSGRVSHAMVLRPGAVLAGKYSLRREIGRGAVGLVFEAEHLRLRQRFAVKALNGHLRTEKDLVERFEREARAMASLKSPYVTSIFDVDILPDGTPYLVMELLEGKDLQRELRERKTIPTGELVRIILQACEGLAVVHAAGIVHRDLKPSNLFLSQQGTSRIVKVMDFGISKVAGDDATQTGSSLGTPAYMSPEQVRSPRDVDARSDVWALGVILYRALTGHLPFEGEGITGMAVAIANEEPKPLSVARPDLPVALVRVVETMLQKKRELRFESVLVAREALVPFAEEMPLSPYAIPVSPVPSPRSLSSVARASRLEAAATTQQSSGTSASAPPGVTSTLTSSRRPATSWVLGAAVAALLVAAAVVPWVLRRSRPASPIPPAVAETPPLLAPPSREQTAPVTPALDTASQNNEVLELESSAPLSGPSAKVAPPTVTKTEKKPAVEAAKKPTTPPKKPDLPNLL